MFILNLYLNKGVKKEIFIKDDRFDDFKVPFSDVVQESDKTLLLR